LAGSIVSTSGGDEQAAIIKTATSIALTRKDMS
jgi:hypothetical protein